VFSSREPVPTSLENTFVHFTEPLMTRHSQTEVVANQFGPRAQAYLDSPVHAAGQDLDLLEQRVGSRPEAIALDMGCGGGHVSFRLAPLVKKMVAYDLSPDMLATVTEESRRRGLQNIVTKQGAAEDLPCPSEAFDVAATRFSAHHWRDLPAGLAQMHRVLKPGGMGFFMDTIAPEDPLLDSWLQTLELLRDPSHVRNPSLEGWRAMLTKAGFIVEETAQFRIRLDFAAWISRMKPPAVHVEAIRSLQQRAPLEVVDYFRIEGDGSFELDTAMIVARKG
jgi:SAM-dependent methyltransferase